MSTADKPYYADFDPPRKFMAIESIIAKRLIEHPKATCSYSGGSDSDTMIDLVERVRRSYDLPPVRYTFFNTGLEMRATKEHVRATAEKYGVEIEEVKPRMSIVQAVRRYGQPIMSKAFSLHAGRWQKHPEVTLDIIEEFERCDDKEGKIRELVERYPGCKKIVLWMLSCSNGEKPSMFNLNCYSYMAEFLRDNPPHFSISDMCCDVCKKEPAHRAHEGYEMVITGERFSEGGRRSTISGCFNEMQNGQFRLRPIFYVSDRDKAWYKEYYGLRYSDAYEVYGLKRTGCCGCPISAKAIEELERIRPYEPNLVKAAWNVFGDSYRYRQAYTEYRERRKAEAKAMKKQVDGQIGMEMSMNDE